MSSLGFILGAWITIIAIFPKSFGGWMAEVRRGYNARMNKLK